MLSTVSFHHLPSPSFHRSSKKPSKCRSPLPKMQLPFFKDRNAFHLLASLQLAVHTSTPATSAPDLLSGTNTPNLRKQGQLALTFALTSHTSCSNSDLIRLSNRLEAAVDGAFAAEDYRARVYKVGGALLADADCGGRLVNALLTGRVSVLRVAVDDLDRLDL